MKKFKLIALTALLAMGTNAFAAIDTYAKYGGLRYGYDAAAATTAGETGAEDKPISVTVEGAIDALGSDKAITIPASFSKTNEDDKTTYFKVVGFSANWSKQADNADGTKYKDVTGLTTMTINVDNFKASTDIANAFTGLASLATLTIQDAAAKAADHVVLTAGNILASAEPGKALKSLATLNIQKTGITIEAGSDFKVDATKNSEKFVALTSVTLPEALATIGASAFEGFKGTSITLPETVTNIGESAFAGSALTTATLPAKATTLGEKIFDGCESLTSATVETVGKLPNATFRGCVELASVTIGEKVNCIGGQAFKGCAKLATVTVNSTVLHTIQKNAFEGCEILASLDFSGTKLKDILADAFKGCKALATISLPETTVELVDNIFADCPIVELNAPKVATIGTTIFGAATEEEPNTTLKTLVLGDCDVDGFGYFQALETVTIGTGDVAANAFEYCIKLTTFTMTDGNVAANAFLNCTGLKTFNYIDKVPGITDGDIDQDAFLGCTAFVQIVTTATFQSEHGNAPHQTKWATSANSTMKTVADTGTSGKAFGIFENTSAADIIVPAAEGINFYSIYVDEGTAYFQALRKYNGKYIIAPKAHVVIKTDAARDNIEYTSETASGDNSALVDEVITLNWGGESYNTFGPVTEYTVAQFQANANMAEGEYLYRLTNKASTGGFGFTYYTGTKLNAGQFFIVSTKKPAAAAGRLNMIWLDENGNVESDATAIETVKQAVNDGVIYNMAGQQVDGNYKGIVIKNGKKVILK